MEVKRRLVDQKDVDGIIYAKEVSFAFHFFKVSVLYEGTRLMFQLITKIEPTNSYKIVLAKYKEKK